MSSLQSNYAFFLIKLLLHYFKEKSVWLSALIIPNIYWMKNKMETCTSSDLLYNIPPQRKHKMFSEHHFKKVLVELQK